MEIIATQTSCIICKRGIARGKVAQVLDGYVCEECILKMANSDLVEVDTSYDNIDGMCKHPECHPGNNSAASKKVGEDASIPCRLNCESCCCIINQTAIIKHLAT